MIRPVFLFAVAVQYTLAFATIPAAAQQSGGEALAPEVLNTPGAAEIVRERVITRLQAFQTLQAIRAAGLQGTATSVPTDPNAVNPSADRSAANQQAVARIPQRGDAGFLAGFSGGAALARSRARPPAEIVAPTIIDQSSNLVVNAVGSPVSIGNGNIVQQQVANSTAVGAGASASAAATAGSPAARRGSGGPGRPRSATSTATSLGVPVSSDAAAAVPPQASQR